MKKKQPKTTTTKNPNCTRDVYTSQTAHSGFNTYSSDQTDLATYVCKILSNILQLSKSKGIYSVIKNIH